ncbi:MAG: hypothetical protein Ta2B_17770 [Termitinemataceae bacterium]|nr:MAG: hypothetical protein Ta2B_17770 [Termitinemataceae bacterium]
MTYQIPVFANGARGSAAFFFVVLNPIKLTDPTGRETKYRPSGKDFKSDYFGRVILKHYLYGGGKPLSFNDKKWGDYMRNAPADLDHNAPALKEQIGSQIANQSQQLGADVGASMGFDITFQGFTENGEGIIGYNYLHGTESEAGHLQVSGTMLRNQDGSISVNYTAQWNDKLDPNYSYDSDSAKERFAKTIANPTDFTIKITWDDTMTIP